MRAKVVSLPRTTVQERFVGHGSMVTQIFKVCDWCKNLMIDVNLTEWTPNRRKSIISCIRPSLFIWRPIRRGFRMITLLLHCLSFTLQTPSGTNFLKYADEEQHHFQFLVAGKQFFAREHRGSIIGRTLEVWDHWATGESIILKMKKMKNKMLKH